MRSAGAEKLKAKVEQELGDLGMGGALFDIRVEVITEKGGESPGSVKDATGKDSPVGALPRIGPKGFDSVYFFLTPNAGEEAKPLARIASGGELSRIMLALKRATVSQDCSDPCL